MSKKSKKPMADEPKADVPEAAPVKAIQEERSWAPHVTPLGDPTDSPIVGTYGTIIWHAGPEAPGMTPTGILPLVIRYSRVFARVLGETPGMSNEAHLAEYAVQSLANAQWAFSLIRTHARMAGEEGS